MNSYNGFPAAQRQKAQNWLNAQWRAGTLARPTVCCSCGQDEGIIHAHAEDYSEPFAAGKTDQYHLCYACHMMVHCRFGRGREAFLRYLDLLYVGRRVVAFLQPNWAVFKMDMLGSAILRAKEPCSPTTMLAELFTM